MANILSLSARINADASGFKLDPVQRALKQLGDETAKVAAIFDRFTDTSEAAANAQADTSKALQDLIAARREGTVSAEEFAKAFERIREAATQEAAALQRAAQITEANLSPLQRYDNALAELDSQLQAGRISQETYTRATENAARGLSDAERAARGLAVQQKQIENAATSTTLKFNELSGVFSILPGPLGNIAGRISGLSSAGEGLSRIFSGGLAQGFSSVAASVTSLINPVTLALGGITAFAAGASLVARGLVDLEDRVERLGRLANQLGVSFEFVQTLEEAGRRSDVSIEQLSGSFARLQNTLAGADEESKKAQAALQRLGVSVQDFGALSEQQRIDLIGERLAAIEDPAQRSAAAIALFGRSGVQLLPFFNELGGAATDMERFGRAVTDLDRERLADFGGGLDALSLSTQGLGTSLLLPFTGLAEGISFGLAEIIAGITAIVDPIGRILEPALTQIGRVIELIGTNIGNLGRVIGAVFEPFAVVVEAVSSALEPLVDGIFQFLESISNAAVTTVEWLVSFTPIGAIAENVGALGETISRVVTIITTAFSKVGEFVGGLVSQFGDLVAQSPLLQAIGDAISQAFGSVGSVFSTIANAIGGTVGRLLTLAENFLGIDSSAQQAAESTAALGQEIEELTDEERKQAAERDKFLQTFTDRLSKAIDESAKFGEAGFEAALKYQNSVAELQQQFDRGVLNEQTFKVAIEEANAAYESQIDVIRRTAEEAERKAQAEQDAVQRIIESNLEAIRVQEKFGGDSGRAQAADNLLRINDEFERVELKIREARQAGDQATVDALTSRLAVLDQVAARESDIATGALAQRQEEAKAAADAVAQREKLEAEARQKRLQAEQDAARQVAAERQRVNQIVDQQLALQSVGGDQSRLTAAQNLAALEQEILRINQDIANAKTLGDEAAIQAGQRRLAAVNEIANKERDVANGKAAEREREREHFEKLAQQQQKARDEQQRQAEQLAQRQQQEQQQALQAQRKAFEERAQAQQAEFNRQAEITRQLNSVGQQSIGGGDIRSSQGAQAFLRTAANAFDPRAAEQLRLQREQLKLMRALAERLVPEALGYLQQGLTTTVSFLGNTP